MSGRKICSVPGCKDVDSRRHKFPKDIKICEIWLERVGNELLKDVPYTVLISHCYICENHFTNNCIRTSGRLTKKSLPTLNLPDFNGDPNVHSFFYPQQETCSKEIPEKIEEMLRFTSQPSTLSDTPEMELKVKATGKSYAKRKRIKCEVKSEVEFEDCEVECEVKCEVKCEFNSCS